MVGNYGIFNLDTIRSFRDLCLYKLFERNIPKCEIGRNPGELVVCNSGWNCKRITEKKWRGYVLEGDVTGRVKYGLCLF